MFALLSSPADRPAAAEVAWAPPRLVSAAAAAPTAPQLSFLDCLMAPSVFLEQALVYEHDVAVALLEGALADVVAALPSLGCRVDGTSPSPPLKLLATGADGTSGVGFLHGRAAALSLADVLQQQQQSPTTAAVDLPALLFGHLPGALCPAYSGLPLVHVALLELHGGGCVLGLRLSHLLGDWSSARLLLRTLTRAYSHRHAAAQQQQHEASQQLPPMSAAAPVVDALLAAGWRQQQQEERKGSAPFAPLRLKLLQPADQECFDKLAGLSSGSSSPAQQRPARITVIVPTARIVALKQQAAAGQQQQQPDEPNRWCSTHNVVLASVLGLFAQLPGRQQLPHDVSVAVDMRGRVPHAQLELLPEVQRAQLADGAAAQLFGNFFASAILEAALPLQQGSWLIAQGLHAAVSRASEVWAPDHAWAAGISGHVGSDSTGSDSAAKQPPSSQPQVTWTRLHAMGPRALLEQQAALGVLPSLSTTHWRLDWQQDTAMAGQLPADAVPGFSQPQPFPLVIMQQATPRQGGGWMVHVFLDAEEAPRMLQLLEAAGGL